MLISIAKIEGYYFALISKYLLGMNIPSLISPDLINAFAHFIGKYKIILTALTPDTEIFLPSNPLEYKNGDLAQLLDNLTALCCVDSDSIVEFYLMTPDEKNAKKLLIKKQIFCKNAKWTMGHLFTLYSTLLKATNINDPYSILVQNQAKN